MNLKMTFHLNLIIMKTNTPYHPSSWTTAQWVIFIIVLILLLFLTVGIKAQNHPFDRDFIDKKAFDYVNSKNNRALVIGIIKNGQKEVFTYGETEKGNKITPDKNAIFEIGQMTEVFTTSLLSILESEGKISSHEAVQDILKGVVKVPYYQRVICQKYPTDYPQNDEFRLPKTVCFPDPNEVPQMIVLCDLATHSSGLPEEPSMSLFMGKNPYKDYTLDKLNQFTNKLPPNQAFGYEYQHSMVGMALLGEAMSFKLKKDYPTLLKEKILDPLSMKHTFTTPTAEQAALFLDGHTSKGVLTSHRDYNALTPAAGIRASVPDLLTFIEANLNLKTNLNLALKETHIPRIYTDMRTPQYMMGWGWIIAPLDERDAANKKKMLWQCGERGGFATFMAFVKESNTAVVVLSNTVNSVDDLGHEILKNLEKTPEKVKTASIEVIKN
jgi:CubicO group peptidase (beta-lactamase class C family)